MTRSRSCFTSVFLALTLLAASSVCAQTYTALYNFGATNTASKLPTSSLVQGPDGALYGTTNIGGTNGVGTVYRLTTAGAVQVIYNFCSQTNCADGSYPVTGLTLRPNGHFLGHTGGGGTSNGGVIFDISDTGTYTVLYDGAGLIVDPFIIGPDGQFYAYYKGGGSTGCGGIYRFVAATSGATLKPLYSFTNAANTPCEPTAITVGTDGNFYGTTAGVNYDGGLNCGVLFKLTLTGTLTVIHEFTSSEGCTPQSLTLGSDGNFYGTSTFNNGIFQITPAGTVNVLQALSKTQGELIVAGLVEGSDGNYYGAANTGGTGTNKECFGEGCGTLFETSSAGAFNDLYNFDFTTGKWPENIPVQHTNGVFYGPAGGGSYGSGCGNQYCGVLYSLNNSLTPFAALTPYAAKAGTSIEILGQGFTSSSTVSFNGTAATSVQVSSATRLTATLPGGATTGPVTVTTSSGTLTSNQPFVVIP
jgi:uncharacterized repeat protein (TIGR03803 family)